MSENDKTFGHVPNFTGYMQVVFDEICGAVPRGARILDLPAGNGLLGGRLRECGYEVVQADVNDEKPDYLRADMEERLPFEDASFDAVLCLEGIEHVTNQPQLLAELVRVARPGAEIVVSTPNISNLLSRFRFLFTGCFYQFDPRNFRFAQPGRPIDKGHIAPISLYHLAYAMAANGAPLVRTSGDRFKKKILLPLALLLWPLLAWNSRRVVAGLDAKMTPPARSESAFFSLRLLFSRSLIAVFRRAPVPARA